MPLKVKADTLAYNKNTKTERQRFYKKLEYFDLHCDTLYELYKRKINFDNNLLHINSGTVSGFSPYTQVFAVWSENTLPEEDQWIQFLNIIDNFNVNVKPTLPENMKYILACEGAGLLAGNISRLNTLYNAGVRFLTLVWQDECCMGGAWNLEKGLTSFGKDVLKQSFELGIIPDLSHASDAMFYEAAEEAEKRGRPIVCTHSNSRTVRLHGRNLTDEMFKTVGALGGVVGISFAPQHLTDKENADTSDIISHIEHYFELGGENYVCLGCDFDGIAKTPTDIKNAGELYKLADLMTQEGYSESQITGLFSRNAQRFISKTILS